MAMLGSTVVQAQFLGIAGLLNPEGPRFFPQSIIYPRHPGKPDPRWRNFKWEYSDVDTKAGKYRLYFYEEEQRWPARLAIPRINSQIEALQKEFSYSPPARFSYVLFTSAQEFRQANVFSISEGVEGITSTTEPTMAIPFWGQSAVFDHISKHELVHQFQVQKTGMTDRMGGMDDSVSVLPLWFIEGMAEYYSIGRMDPETRMMVRDVLLYPKASDGQEMPKFFDEGPLNFLGVYKIGQAKIDFIETTFGKGSAQRLLVPQPKDETIRSFQEVVPKILVLTEGEIETKWNEYLKNNYKVPADKLTQPMDKLEMVEEAGENLDVFDVSPNGEIMAIREIDPLAGTTSIRIIDLKNKGHQFEVAHDQRPDLLSLGFMQQPGLAVTNDRVGYLVGTVMGPELETRGLYREGQDLNARSRHRSELWKYGIIQAHSPAFRPDGAQLAFVGLDRNGWENIYVIDLDGNSKPAAPKRLTSEYYSWKFLNWSSTGLFASSDQTPDGKYNLFRVDPTSGKFTRMSASAEDQLAPEQTGRGVLFQSWESGSSQIHQIQGETEIRLTDAKTGLMNPKLRGDQLYVQGFKSGRYHVYRIPQANLLNIPFRSDLSQAIAAAQPKWTASLADLPGKDVHHYRPFISSGTRIDGLMGFFGSGGVAGLSAGVSDLMRNYSLAGEFTYYDSFKYSNMYLFLTSQVGKTTWTVGSYHVAQSRLDTIFSTDQDVKTFLYREFGVMGVIQQPLGAFSYYDVELRLAGVRRSDFSDLAIAPTWDALNPGTEVMLAPMLRLGYDRILYEMFSGPLRGYGFLIETDTSIFPRRWSVTQRTRFDASYYYQAFGRTVLAFQGIGGIAWGGKFRNPFFLASDDLFRAYPFGDDRLYGSHFWGLKSELRFPIGTFFGFPPLRGLLSYDFGSIFIDPHRMPKNIASAYSGGIYLNLPPISIQFISSYPIRVAPGPKDSSVFHFLLRYLYL